LTFDVSWVDDVLALKYVRQIKFTLEQAMKSQRGSRDIPLYINYLGDTLESMVSATPRPLYPRKRAPVPLVKDAGWAPGPVLTSMENRNPFFQPGVEIRTVQPVAVSQSGLRYSCPHVKTKYVLIQGYVTQTEACPFRTYLYVY
jgi:hypothetical protein